MRAECTVFVGNLSQAATEEEINEFFEEVAPPKELRLPTEKDSGRRRGYGFVEMADPQLAEAARRHLHGRELKGKSVRIDLSNDAKAAHGEPSGPSSKASSGPPSRNKAPKKEREEEHDAEPSDASTDAIARKLSELNTKQLFDLLRQVKSLAESDFLKARQMLSSNPQLTQVLPRSCPILDTSPLIICFAFAIHCRRSSRLSSCSV